MTLIIRKTSKTKDAIVWREEIGETARLQFPTPSTEQDIENYYESPLEYSVNMN